MPRLTIEFNLPEEHEDWEHARMGQEYYFVLTDFREHLRSRLKYGELGEVEQSVLEVVQQKFFELCRDRGVEL